MTLWKRIIAWVFPNRLTIDEAIQQDMDEAIQQSLNEAAACHYLGSVVDPDNLPDRFRIVDGNMEGMK